MRRVLKKLGIGIAIAAAFLVVAEVVARLALGLPARWALDVPYESDDVVGFRVAPNASIGDFTTTSIGTRGREVDFSARERILVLGDSMTLAADVGDGETFCAMLERALGTGAQVVNGGCPGYGPREELAALERLAPIVKPTSIVVVFFPGNDIQDAGQDSRYEVLGGVLVPAARAESMGFFGRLGVWWRVKTFPLGLSRLLRRLTGRVDPRDGGAAGEAVHAAAAATGTAGMTPAAVRAIVELDDYTRAHGPGAEDVARGWPRMPHVFERMREAARQFGAPLLAVYLPLPLAYDPGMRANTAAAWGVAPAAFDPSRPARKMMDLFRSLDIRAIDLSASFEAAPNAPALHQLGDLHLSARGHELVARELSRALANGR